MNTHTSIWDAIEDNKADAENMKRRSSLIVSIRDCIRRHDWTPSEAAQRFHVSETQIAYIIDGKIDSLATEALTTMADYIPS